MGNLNLFEKLNSFFLTERVLLCVYMYVCIYVYV